MKVFEQFARNGIEATMNLFCAKLEDALADRNHSHKITWQQHPTGGINVLIGNQECYTIFPASNNWIVTYNY